MDGIGICNLKLQREFSRTKAGVAFSVYIQSKPSLDLELFGVKQLPFTHRLRRATMRLALILVITLLLPSTPIPQEGIPQNIGTGRYPEGLLNNSDIKDLTRRRIEALKQRVKVVKERFEAGTIPYTQLYQANQDLLSAQLDSTDAKEIRLKYIEESLANALMVWQLTRAKADKGLRGGEADALLSFEEQVFHFRILWLKEKEMP